MNRDDHTSVEAQELTPLVYVYTAAAAALIFVLAMALSLFTDADPGSAPDWLAAVATLAAFAAAVIAGVFAGKAVQREARRDRSRDEEAKRSQAALIAAWPAETKRWTQAMGGTTFTGLQPVSGVMIRLRNASPLPVRDVVIQVEVRVRDSDGVEKRSEFGTSGRIAYLPPTDVLQYWEEEVHGIASLPQELFVTDSDDNPVFELVTTFTDTSGRRWSRGLDSTLQPVDSEHLAPDALPVFPLGVTVGEIVEDPPQPSA